MLPKSLNSARASIRDFFHGSISTRRRGKQPCCGESADEWGRTVDATTHVQQMVSSKNETSDDTFFTSCSVQSNITDMPIPPMDNAIIKDGAQKLVGNLQHAPTMPESYPEIDHALSCSGAHLEQPTGRGLPNSSSCPQSYLLLNNHHQQTTRATDARVHQQIKHCNGRRKSTSGDWLITNSALFAYNAMGGRSRAEDTELYAWLQRYHGKCGPESDCASLRRRLEALDLNAPADEEEKKQDKGGFLIPRPHQGATTPWPEPMNMPVGQSSRTREEKGSMTAGGVVDTQFQSPVAGVCGYSTMEDFTGTYDVSDGEDSGRISPDTFRLWASGCVYRTQTKTVQNAEYDGESRILPHRAENYPLANDTYDLTSDDSIATSITSISSDKQRDILTWQRKLSIHTLNPPTQEPTRLPSKVYTLTLPLIKEAISYPNAPPTFHTVPKNHYTQVLDYRVEFLENSDIYISRLTGIREDLYQKLADLHEILESITTHANQIMKRRYPPPQTEEAVVKQQERDGVYHCMEDFMRNMTAEYDARHEELDSLAAEIDRLTRLEDELKVRIEAVGDMVGVGMEEVNGDMRDMERLVRLIDEGEAELEMDSGGDECF